jgi:thiol-disulfide isomerase/thioredoxin
MQPITLITAVLALGVLAGAQDQSPPVKQKPAEASRAERLKVGSAIDENLTLVDLDGKELKFKDLRGKVVLLHFWSIDCPFVKVADPKFEALSKRWKDQRDVVILAVNSNSTEIGPTRPTQGPGYERIREHLKHRQLAFPVYADHGNRLADLMGAQSTPHCFVLDKQGVLVYAGALDDDPKGELGERATALARDAVETTLAGKVPGAQETKPYGCTIKRIRP